MDKVSELTGAAAKVKDVLTAYASYRKAVNADALSKASNDAKVPDAHVFHKEIENQDAVIVILAERHDSDDDQVRGGAEGVAKKAMLIPKVKIAVEEPITYNGTQLSNVGFGQDVTKKKQAQALFDFAPSAEGSISHQIYVKQVGGMVVNTSRYAAEQMPRDPKRYNNPKINKTMAEKLIANTGKGEVSVFPVGPDHLLARYDAKTLRVHLEKEGWKLLANK
jgi:hypothetical protein